MNSGLINLFAPAVAEERQHPIFSRLQQPEYLPEQEVLNHWSEGFVDRDGKFVQEFQTSFESSMWELYIFACIKDLGGKVEFSHIAPDFVTSLADQDLCIEATVARPAQGSAPPHGAGPPDPLNDLYAFNAESMLRICNSFERKAKKYLRSYGSFSHVQGKPYVIALAPFSSPHSHFSVDRPIATALYGIFADEEATLSLGLPEILQYAVNAVAKTPSTDVDLGYFCDADYDFVSAVIYSPIANWGKIRALAAAPNAWTFYHTLHRNPNSLAPRFRSAMKQDYTEHLLDGLYIFHNPFARIPLDPTTFCHERVAQIVFEDGLTPRLIAPLDFLQVRMLYSLRQQTVPK
ncbi:MAG: glycosaminoglycan attachment site [Chloroflexota bacterium]|nr:glycosaminoglycan attachment site [Chloroflexota bacterium]